jgi:hypothetical protein
MLDEEGPEGPRERPVAWVFRWIDQLELGAQVHAVRFPTPTDVAWGGASLRLAAAGSGQALFVVHAARRVFLVRADTKGGRDLAEVTAKEVPTGEVVFGEGTGDAIAWLHETDVLAWLPRTAPRRVARVASSTSRVLGTPTRNGIPLLIGAKDWAMTRMLALPAPAAPATFDGIAPVPSIDGWVSQPPIRQALGSLPQCSRNPHGMRFVLSRQSLRGTIDGSARPPAYALYDVRVEGANACVAGVYAAFGATAHGEAASFVRVDFTRQRGEGGERGIGGRVRAVECALRAGG